MSSEIRVYKDTEANAVYFENQLGAYFTNNLHADIPDPATGKVDIVDSARQRPVVSAADHSRFVDAGGVPYGSTPTETCDNLNAMFAASGTAGGEPPEITSALTVNVTQGDTINYELVADRGVGFEWDGLPSGLVPVEGNVRKLVGGTGLAIGTYLAQARAVNYHGEDVQNISFVVDAPAYLNTKSAKFNNGDYLGANAALLENILGRPGNGAGSADAWSVAIWIKPGTATNQQQTILYFGGQSVSNTGYVQFKYDGNVGSGQCFVLRYGTNNNRLSLRTDPGTLTPGVWTHLLVTYDGGTTGVASGSLSDYYSRFNVYLDGTPTNLTGSHNNYGYNGSVLGDNFRVGRWNNGQSLRNNTLIDEVAIWEGDRGGDASAIYNGGVPHDLQLLSNSPDHYWRMGDGDTYPIIEDKVGFAHFQMYNMNAADIVNDVP
jgi:hypothetical protein